MHSLAVWVFFLHLMHHTSLLGIATLDCVSCCIYFVSSSRWAANTPFSLDLDFALFFLDILSSFDEIDDSASNSLASLLEESHCLGYFLEIYSIFRARLMRESNILVRVTISCSLSFLLFDLFKNQALKFLSASGNSICLAKSLICSMDFLIDTFPCLVSPRFLKSSSLVNSSHRNLEWMLFSVIFMWEVCLAD